MPHAAYLYAPAQSKQAMEVLYVEHVAELRQEFGFLHAFNPTRNWRTNFSVTSRPRSTPFPLLVRVDMIHNCYTKIKD
jgi:hypothetical protein